MSDYSVQIPYFIEDDVDYFYDYLFEFGETTAERFHMDFKGKVAQIQQFPFSCAVDTVYPSLIGKQIRKAIIYDGRYLLLYMIRGKNVVVLMVERAERDYIATFEANLRLYEDEKQQDG